MGTRPRAGVDDHRALSGAAEHRAESAVHGRRGRRGRSRNPCRQTRRRAESARLPLPHSLRPRRARGRRPLAGPAVLTRGDPVALTWHHANGTTGQRRLHRRGDRPHPRSRSRRIPRQPRRAQSPAGAHHRSLQTPDHHPIADSRFVLDQLELLAAGTHRDADGRALLSTCPTANTSATPTTKSCSPNWDTPQQRSSAQSIPPTASPSYTTHSLPSSAPTCPTPAARTEQRHQAAHEPAAGPRHRAESPPPPAREHVPADHPHRGSRSQQTRERNSLPPPRSRI